MTIRRLLAPVLTLFLMAFAAKASAQMPQLPPLEFKFDKLEAALHLTPAQKEQYDVAVGATKRVLFQVALVGMQMKEKLAAELAKPRPDFEFLADARKALVDEGRTLRREARDEWQKLYATLDAEQVAILRRFVESQLGHVGLLHDFMLQLILGGTRER